MNQECGEIEPGNAEVTCLPPPPGPPTPAPRSCGNEPNITEWAAQLYGTGRQLMLENCNDDTPHYATATSCPYNAFRTSTDMGPHWDTTLHNAWDTATYLRIARPGCFPQADVLTIGTPAWDARRGRYPDDGCNGTRLGEAEARAQMALWCVMSSPLVHGLDVRNVTERARWGPILVHPRALAINEAWAGEAGRVVARSPANWTGTIPIGSYCESSRRVSLPLWGVFGKQLSPTTFAAVVVAGSWRGPVDFAAPITDMGFPAGATLSSTDVWTGADLGDVSGVWAGTCTAPCGEWRLFSLRTA